MTVREIAIMVCDKADISQYELAERVGCSRSTIATQLSRRNGMGMTVEAFLRMMEAMDCQVIVCPPDDSGEMILDGED